MSIANYIKEDLAARLQSSQKLPVQLTLGSLSEFYQVSFTPVRAAVSELIEEGLLEKGENRRLTPGKGKKKWGRHKQNYPLPQRPSDPFETIRDDLIQLSLKGDAVYLREEATAEKYEISRSAIRNIFHQLAGLGMLDHIPRRGWRVRPFRLEDLRAFLEVREVLELKALELARPHLEQAELRRLAELNTLPVSPSAPLDVDESLHTYIIATSGNSYISDFFERHARYFNVLFKWEDKDRAAALEAIHQHREVLEALLKKNWRTARKALSHHIRHNHPILGNVIHS